MTDFTFVLVGIERSVVRLEETLLFIFRDSRTSIDNFDLKAKSVWAVDEMYFGALYLYGWVSRRKLYRIGNKIQQYLIKPEFVHGKQRVVVLIYSSHFYLDLLLVCLGSHDLDGGENNLSESYFLIMGLKSVELDYITVEEALYLRKYETCCVDKYSHLS